MKFEEEDLNKCDGGIFEHNLFNIYVTFTIDGHQLQVEGTFHRKTFQRQNILKTGNLIDMTFKDRSFYRQNISQTGHFIERTLITYNRAFNCAFYRQR